MSAIEELHKTVWEVLVEIKQEALVTPDDEWILISTHTDELWRAVRYLVKLGAIKATEHSPLLRGASAIKLVQEMNGRIYKPNAYRIEILQPRFNDIYNVYERTQSEASTKTTLDYIKEIIRTLMQEYKKYPAGEKIRYEVYVGEDDSENDEMVNQYHRRVEALNELKQEGVIVDYTLEDRNDDIQHNEIFGTRIEYKIARCLVDKKKLSEHIQHKTSYSLETFSSEVTQRVADKLGLKSGKTYTLKEASTDTSKISEPANDEQEKMFWITYQGRSIILNTPDSKYHINKLQFFRDNERTFEYIFGKPNEELTSKQISEDTGKSVDFNKFVGAIGFKGELRKAFFDVSKTAIRFIGELTAKNLEHRGIDITKLNTQIKKLREFSPE